MRLVLSVVVGLIGGCFLVVGCGWGVAVGWMFF